MSCFNSPKPKDIHFTGIHDSEVRNRHQRVFKYNKHKQKCLTNKKPGQGSADKMPLKSKQVLPIWPPGGDCSLVREPGQKAGWVTASLGFEWDFWTICRRAVASWLKRVTTKQVAICWFGRGGAGGEMQFGSCGAKTSFVVFPGTRLP